MLERPVAGALVRAKVGCDGDLVAGVLAADPPAVRELLRRLYTAYCLQRMPGAALPPPLHAHAGAAPPAAPCTLGVLTGAQLGASEPGLAAARGPRTSDSEPQAPGLADAGVKAPALVAGLEPAGAEMRSFPWAPGLSAPAGLASSGSAGLAALRTLEKELEPQAGSRGLQHSLPGFDSALDTTCTARDPSAIQFEQRLAASTPQLSCSIAWQPPGSRHAGSSLVPGTRLTREGRSAAVVLESFQRVTGNGLAASEPSSSMAAPGNMLHGEAGCSADAAPRLLALDCTAPEQPRMLACAFVTSPQPLLSHQVELLKLTGDGSPAASRSGIWRAEAGAAAPWPRCSLSALSLRNLSASFQGSAGVPEPVACDSPRLRSPAASQGVGFSTKPWAPPSRARRALFLDSVASAGADGGPGQASWGDACSIDALGQAAPCTQGSLEAHAPACPAAAPCQRYPSGETSLLSPEPAGVLPQAPMPAQRSPLAVEATPSDAWGGRSRGSTGPLCAAAEAAHACKRGHDSSMVPAIATLRRPLRPLCGTPAACRAAPAPGAHSGATSCPERALARGAAISACAKVWGHC